MAIECSANATEACQDGCHCQQPMPRVEGTNICNMAPSLLMKPIVLTSFVPTVLPHPFQKHFDDEGLFILHPGLWDKDQGPLRVLEPEMRSEVPAHQMSIFCSLSQMHRL